jgi:hypothetical protein
MAGVLLLYAPQPLERGNPPSEKIKQELKEEPLH